jgi:hypothetical protein
MNCGQPVPRPPEAKPDCRHCPRPLRWTDENRGVAMRWRAWREGLLQPSGAAEKWDFLRLSLAAREIERVLKARELANMVRGRK